MRASRSNPELTAVPGERRKERTVGEQPRAHLGSMREKKLQRKGLQDVKLKTHSGPKTERGK